MEPEDDRSGLSGGPQDPATEAAGTPLRGDLVCKSPFRREAAPIPVPNRSETAPEPAGNRSGRGAGGIVDMVLDAAREPRAVGRGPGGRGCRSPMFDWMLRHHDALAPELDGPRTPNWRALATRLAELGATDGAGHAAKPDVARRTWRRVKAAKAGQAGGGPREQASSAAGSPAKGPPPATTEERKAFAVPQMVGEGRAAPAQRFSMGARPRPWSPPPDASEE